MDNNRLDQLFNEAKNQAPKASFDKTKERFISSLKNGGGATSSNQLINSNLLKIILIMTSSIAIIGISLFIWNKAPNNQSISIENKNILRQDKIEKIKNIEPKNISSKIIKYEKNDASNKSNNIFLSNVNEFIVNNENSFQKENINSTTALKNNRIEEEAYQFPTLTEEEKDDVERQKKLMMKKLAKKDKKTYAFIPSGTYNKHSVNAFYMQTTEVTVLEYRTFLFDLLMQDRKEDFLKAKPLQEQWVNTLGEHAKPLTDHYFSHIAYNYYPINNISLKGVWLYCKWLNEELIKSGYLKKNESISEIRLPNEIEWMYAASGGNKQSPYPWGGPYVRNKTGCYLANFKPGKDTSMTCDAWNKLKGVDDKDSMSNFIQTMDDARLPKINNNPYSADGGLFTVQVGSYNPNDFGLFCMSGNIAEMVLDVKTNQPMAKGGSWMSPMHELQINNKGTHQGETGPKIDVGFRVVFSYLN